jgi:hypothetical protein
MSTKRSIVHSNMVLYNRVARKLNRMFQSYKDRGGQVSYIDWLNNIIDNVFKVSCKLN